MIFKISQFYLKTYLSLNKNMFYENYNMDKIIIFLPFVI